MRADAKVKLRDPTVTEIREASPRARRRSGEIQVLMLEAARQTFAAKGYARATTREIAARAGVAEPLLFRKFGSKPKLFAEAVLHPMTQFIRDWIGEMPAAFSAASTEEAQRGFLDRLYTIASEQRGLLLTFFATRVFEPEVLEASGAGISIQDALDELARFTEKQLVHFGIDLGGFNVPIASRSVIGMVLAMALFGDWLLPAGRRRPTRAALLDELTRQVLYGGFNQRPNHPARTPGKQRKRGRRG